MKPTELRLGNLISVYRKPTDKELSHYAVQEIYEWENDENYYVVIDDTFSANIETGIIPIPLTDKWLIDFGYESKFEDEEDNEIFVKDLLEVTKDCFKQEFWISASIITPDRIRYVHQLQNLHYALTGVELLKA